MWNTKVFDLHVAPRFSEFRSANIPDLTGKFPQAEHWVNNYFLNSILGVSFVPGYRQLALAYLRRAQLIHSAYHEARSLTLVFLANDPPESPGISRYYRATTRWEQFAIDASILLDVYKYLNNGEGAFKKDDGSPEGRIYHCANKVKHVGDDVVNRGLYSLTGSVPLWLSDDGLNVVSTLVTYQEAASFVIDAAKVAEEIQNPGGLFEKSMAKTS